MLRTEIVIRNTSDGQPVDVPTDLRRGVERASQILDVDLVPSDHFDITARWTFVRQPSGEVGVLLDLTAPFEGHPVGYTGYPLDADVFSDDTHIRRALKTPVWNFNRTLAYISKIDVKRLQHRVLLQDVVAGK